MRGSGEEIAAYLIRVADLLERYGVTLHIADAEGIDLLEDAQGRLSFQLMGALPAAPGMPEAEIAVRERFDPVRPDRFERTEYEYEVLDRERDNRRAFHLHHPEWFQRTYLVVVHEHCERPIGHAACDHYEGSPIRDAFAGVLRLIETWTGPEPECSALRCLA